MEAALASSVTRACARSSPAAGSPTADDLTAEVVGRFAGREMVLDERWRRRSPRSSSDSRRGMNSIPGPLQRATAAGDGPEGSVAIDPAGTAPGPGTAGDQVVIVLPGPPSELHALWEPALETPPVA